jgi:hypothetical protein
MIKKYLLKHTKRRRRGVEHLQMLAMTGKYTEKELEEKIKESMKRELGY